MEITTSPSYLNSRGNRSSLGLTKAISSSMLDALMASRDSPTDSCSYEKKDDKDVSPSKGSVTSEENERNSKRDLTFTSPKLSESKRSISSEDSPRKRKSIFILSTTDDEDSLRSGNEGSSTDRSTPIKPGCDSSTYLTPVGTPTSHSTPDHRRFKRSLIDHYSSGDRLSANTSWNSSVYNTPDSSPSEYGSSVKRFKTRWSDSRGSNREDSSYSNKSYVSPDSEFQPELIGYQLVGDSQFCRFGQQLLGLQRIPMPNSPGRIGICISGQTITDLHRRVREKTFPISEKIILMIGTNDFLRNVDVGTMCSELSSLIKTLQEDVHEIVLLTLPPIPKLAKNFHSNHFNILKRYNDYIRSLEDGDKLRIADVSPIFFTSPPRQECRMNLFELFFHGPQRRQDLIHLNRNGLEVIRKYILENFL